MSYDIDLEDRSVEPDCGCWPDLCADMKDCPYPSYPMVKVEHHEGEGGTYVIGGTNEASLNVTYNYSGVIALVSPGGLGLREALHDKEAQETIPWLAAMVDVLGVDTYRDYWAPTPGNVGHALNILLGWAMQHPEAVWSVS